MLTIDALKAYGADTQAGLTRCFGNESFYLGLVEMLMYDEKFDALRAAVGEGDIPACRHLVYALADTADNLALTPLTQQIEKMMLCLQLEGDVAVLEKQLALIWLFLEALRTIQRN